MVHLWIDSGSSLIFTPQFFQYSAEVFSTQTDPKHHAAFLAVKDVCVFWHHEFTLKRSENPYSMRRHMFGSGKKNAQRCSYLHALGPTLALVQSIPNLIREFMVLIQNSLRNSPSKGNQESFLVWDDVDPLDRIDLEQV